MANYLTTDTDLGKVADAIRTKGGTSEPLSFPGGFVTAIESIPSGGGSSFFEIVDVVYDNKTGATSAAIPITNTSMDNYLLIYAPIETGVYTDGVLTMDSTPTFPTGLNIATHGSCLRIGNASGRINFDGKVGSTSTNSWFYRGCGAARGSLSTYGSTASGVGASLSTDNGTITISNQYAFGRAGYYIKYRVYVHGWMQGVASDTIAEKNM